MRDKRVVSYITLKEAVSIADIAHKQNVTISEIKKHRYGILDK